MVGGMRRVGVFALLPWLLLAAAGCSAAPEGETAGAPAEPRIFRGEAWPAADALFRADRRWLGADSAYSVPLGDDRILWLFGDTFVAMTDPPTRQEARMVRNSVAIQRGRCPTDASIRFHWGEGEDGAPEAFATVPGDRWLWPLHGIVLEGELTLFFMRETRAGGLGFETVGWEAFRVPNPEAQPPDWTLEPLEGFESPFPVVVGAAVLRWRGHVYAYAVREPGAHRVYLVRWDRAAFARGDLSTPRWYAGEDGWVAHDALQGSPTAVIDEGQVELSVSLHRSVGRFVQVQSLGFGATTIGARTAPGPAGPWTDAEVVFEPPESARSDALVYAAKGHPGLRCEGQEGGLAVTYVANARRPADVLGEPSLYYPRFVRVWKDGARSSVP